MTKKHKGKILVGKRGREFESWWELYHNPLSNEDIKSICKANFIGLIFPEWLWRKQS